MEGCLILSPESDEDEQALFALAEAWQPMRWSASLAMVDASELKMVNAQGLGAPQDTQQ